MSEWYDRAFGPWYLALYPHRDAAEAVRALDTLGRWIPRGERILDVGCGPGRHLETLLASGWNAVGVDRSTTLLGEAARGARAPGRLVRGDMRRLPFASGSFGAVMSMFTSFGYFATRRDHGDLLHEYARVAGVGARLVLDYLDDAGVRRGLVPASARAVAGHDVEERRAIVPGPDGDRVVKEIVIRTPGGQEVERYREDVALYAPDEVRALLAGAGWRTLAELGDYAGAAWTEGSPRFLVVAERTAA